MKTDKFLWDVVGAIGILFYGSFLLLSSLYSFGEVKTLISVFFGIYGVSHLFLSSESVHTKEYSHFLLGIMGVIAFGISYLTPVWNTTKSFSFFLLMNALLISFIKLKKADYFHDRKNILWRVELSFLLLYLLTTILLCVNLANTNDILILLFGFYIYILGVIEFMEALIANLRGKLK